MTGIYKPPVIYTTPFEKQEKKETVEEIKEYPFYSNPKRKVRDSIYKALGFRMKVNEKDGKTLEAAYYPILKNGKLSGWKKRDFTKPKKHAFSIIGEVDATCELVGAWKLRPGRKIIITEGEEDYAAAYQAALDQINSNPKWKGKIHPNVVSVVGGAPYAAENIANNLSILNEYDEVITCFDSDRATRKEFERGVRKGYEATCETHLLVGFEKCKYIPMKLKDASEYLQNGRQSELGELLAFGARDFTPVTIEEGDDYSLDELMTPNEEGTYVKTLPKTMEILHGFRPYEGTLILAPEKSGKTTITKQVVYDIMLEYIEGKVEGKAGHIFLEENGKKTRQSYLALETGVSLPKFREDPSILSREEAERAYKKLFQTGKNIFLNTKEGKLAPDQVANHLKFMYAKGCRTIVLDHLSMVVSGSTNSNERKEIDNLLTEIAAFCESHPVHLIVIAHIKRTDWKPKTDDDGEVIYPYWKPVNLEDARGSGSFGQLMWNCICLEPEIIDEAGTIGRVRTKVAMCREWGTKGIGDYLKYDLEQGKMVKARRD